jgi:hypothetical protein
MTQGVTRPGRDPGPRVAGLPAEATDQVRGEGFLWLMPGAEKASCPTDVSLTSAALPRSPLPPPHGEGASQHNIGFGKSWERKEQIGRGN